MEQFKKSILSASISLQVGFWLAIGIANYFIPLFWHKKLTIGLGFLVTATFSQSIITYLIIVWMKSNWPGILKLARNIRTVIEKKNHLFMALYIVIAGICAFALLRWITPIGSGVSPDSTVYIDTARNLQKGAGFYAFREPLTHFPPLYPVFLALANHFEQDIFQAAGLLNDLIFAINIGLVAWAVYLASRNFLAISGAIFFFVSSSELLWVYTYVWSEPLFITFILACIVLLSMYCVSQTLSLLVTSSIFLGLAFVTRYIGIAFLPAALLIVFSTGLQRRISLGIRDTIIFLVLACVPIGIWSIRNIFAAGTVADRVVVFHPLPISEFDKFMLRMHDFILPIKIPNSIKLVDFGLLSVILIIGLVFLVKKRLFKEINWHSIAFVISIACFLFSIFYLLGLIISISFIDASTPVDARLLSPVFALLIIGTFSVAWRLSQKLKKPMVWWSFFFFVILSIGLKTPTTINMVTSFQIHNSGFRTLTWRNSKTLAFVNTLSGDAKIYSNGFDVLGVMTAKEARSIPKKLEPTSLLVNQNYEQEMTVMCKDIKNNGALLVFFTKLTNRSFFPTQAELKSDCQLSVMQHFSDGTFYISK